MLKISLRNLVQIAFSKLPELKKGEMGLEPQLLEKIFFPCTKCSLLSGWTRLRGCYELNRSNLLNLTITIMKNFHTANIAIVKVIHPVPKNNYHSTCNNKTSQTQNHWNDPRNSLEPCTHKPHIHIYYTQSFRINETIKT